MLDENHTPFLFFVVEKSVFSMPPLVVDSVHSTSVFSKDAPHTYRVSCRSGELSQPQGRGFRTRVALRSC